MVLEIVGWSVTAAAVTWGLTLSWAAVAMASRREAMQEDIDHWHAEAMRARQMVIQLKHEAAMWSRGRQDGREDLHRHDAATHSGSAGKNSLLAGGS